MAHPSALVPCLQGCPPAPSDCPCPTQVTHWHSPYFFAYFPTASSYPAMLADMLCGAIGCIGFSWVSVGRGVSWGSHKGHAARIQAVSRWEGEGCGSGQRGPRVGICSLGKQRGSLSTSESQLCTAVCLEVLGFNSNHSRGPGSAGVHSRAAC